MEDEYKGIFVIQHNILVKPEDLKLFRRMANDENANTHQECITFNLKIIRHNQIPS